MNHDQAPRLVADAARNLRDVRLAYRNRAEKFATLFVAEAAHLAAAQAQVHAAAAQHGRGGPVDRAGSGRRVHAGGL
jgi:hypothetical protein